MTLGLAGAVNRQGATDENGRVAFLDLPLAGGVTITPSRSGFRFEPPQLTIPDLGNPVAATFVAFPTATDLALSIESDDAAPLVGGLLAGWDRRTERQVDWVSGSSVLLFPSVIFGG